MDYKKLAERLREEPKDSRKAVLSIYDLCVDAAVAIETLLHTLDMAQRERDVVTKRMIELEQETVTKCSDMFDEDGGEILNDETVTDRHRMTNADRIRSMSDEEMAEFLLKLMGHAKCFAEGMFPYHPCPQNHNCKQCGIKWLQRTAEEDEK